LEALSYQKKIENLENYINNPKTDNKKEDILTKQQIEPQRYLDQAENDENFKHDLHFTIQRFSSEKAQTEAKL
jgi:hypothetical protein